MLDIWRDYHDETEKEEKSKLKFEIKYACFIHLYERPDYINCDVFFTYRLGT